MVNYFALLGVEPRFTLDEHTLQQAYIKIQQQFHPDRMVGKSDAERARAVQQSMDANEGYELLKSPLGKAEHLLALEGIFVNADEKDAHKPSQELLMEMLETREALSEVQSEPEIAKQIQDIKVAMKRLNERLATLFEEKAWDEAAQQTIRLRYLGKALEEAMSYHYQLKHAS